MFNLKMSEVFSELSGLVVHVNINKVKVNFDDGVTPFDAIDYAVANHDGLVSENLSLKAEVRKLKGDDESLSLTRPSRPDLSSIPLEVVRYIESLEYGIDKVDSMCLKHATRCDELHEALDGLLGVLDGEWTHSKRVHAQMDEAKNSLKAKGLIEDGQHEI